MTQMASLLTVATVFVGLWTLNIYILQSEKGGLYERQNYLCRNLSKKCRRGGLYARGAYLRDSKVILMQSRDVDV
jgi:hypothetical protein